MMARCGGARIKVFRHKVHTLHIDKPPIRQPTSSQLYTMTRKVSCLLAEVLYLLAASRSLGKGGVLKYDHEPCSDPRPMSTGP